MKEYDPIPRAARSLPEQRAQRAAIARQRDPERLAERLLALPGMSRMLAAVAAEILDRDDVAAVIRQGVPTKGDW